MPFTDRREFGRRRSQMHGWVKVAGRPPIPCQVTNLSQKGAFVAFSPPSWMPFQFELILSTEAPARLCELRHMRTDGVGVVFFESAKPAIEAPRLLLHDPAVDEWLGLERLRTQYR